MEYHGGGVDGIDKPNEDWLRWLRRQHNKKHQDKEEDEEARCSKSTYGLREENERERDFKI